MRSQTKIIILALIIVCLGSFASYWLMPRGAPEDSTEPKAESSYASRPSKTPGLVSKKQSTLPESSKFARSELQPTMASTTSELSASASASLPASSSRAASRSVANAPSIGETPLPKPASELLAKFIEQSGKSAFQTPISQGHAAMQSEQSDPSWSPVASYELNEYLSQQLGDRFEFPVVQCQADICEIQSAGLPGVKGNSDGLDFQAIIGSMHKQPWWTELGFDEETLSMTDKQGRLLFVVYVTRK